MMIEQMATSFVASTAFGMIFNVPKRALLLCGLVGLLGWMLYYLLTIQDMNAIIATLIAAVGVAMLSHALARWKRIPITVFGVSGIIPLVPGGLAYDAMRHLVESEYTIAVQQGVKALMVSGSIAMGLVLSEVFHQLIRKTWANRRRNA
ncbi:threonine/serine exporter family protein [Paenibacillus chungangensis]|uniref:Threonine/serine exporter family protein n=1 Tax=Paenibacillus chungangensis TaxID=696535 RepID=A0ABW3HQ36_9BACL